MNDTSSPREFRIKGGDRLRSLIGRFSPTERAVFMALLGIALVSALVLAYRASQLFMVTVPARGGTLYEGLIGVPRDVNPVLASSDADKDVTALVYAGLMKHDASGDLVPDLAESYSISPDGLTYTFTLKSGLRFSDGTPLTTDDIAFTVGKTQDPALKSPYRADWADVTVKKVSPTEIQFVLKQPYAGFLSDATIGILPERVWQSVSDDEFVFSAYNIEPVGEGPYRVSSVAKDKDGVPTSLALLPNGYYPNSRPYIGAIAFSFYPDEEHAFDALRTGDIQSLAGVDPDDAATVASSSSMRILSSPVPRMFGVFFNQNQNPIFADKAVRQALSESVDRQAIVESVLDGYGVAIDSPVPAAITGSPSVPAANIALATSTLEKDGWKLGSDGVYAKTVNKKPVRLSFAITTADSPDLKQTADMIAAEWRAIGASVSVSVFEYGDLENMISARSYDALLFGQYVGDGLDLYAFWDSSQRNSPGLNVAQYVNSKADADLEDARSATSSAERSADLSAFSSLFAQDLPAVFLYSPDFVYVVPQGLMGVDVSDVSTPADRWNGVESWYIDTERVWKIFAGTGL